MELISLAPDYRGRFSDKRLDKRAAFISNIIMQSKTSSIRSSTSDEASQKAAYRFLKNEKAEEAVLVKALKERTSYLCANREVLVIQDTTTIDLTSHKGRLQPKTGLGPVGNYEGGAIGFFLHAGLVIDPLRSTILGFSSYTQWSRSFDTPNKKDRSYKKLPIEQKEASKWITSSKESKEVLLSAKCITIIEDREGDIYDQFALIPDDRTHLIVRSRDNRKVNKTEKLYDVLAKADVAGHFELSVEGDIRKGIKKRTALIEVRYATVHIERRQQLNKNLPGQVKLYAVQAKEINSSEAKPIMWRLLTTHAIENFSDALWVVNSYKHRWYIEQFFRLMKKKGFKVEDSELESGWAIRKLSVLVAGSVLRVMQMLLCYGDEEAQVITEVFSQEETQCMQVLQKKLQTEKIKNPYSKQSLCWGTWIVARLGGWKGTNKERPPGPICLKNGLDKFNLIYQGWKMAKDVSTR
jgi:hypothetical protein